MKIKCVLIVFLLFGMIGCSGFQSGIKPVTLTYQDKSVGPKKIWPDSDLKEKFSRYWAMRFSDLPTKEIFLNEAPYIQEMVDANKYGVYIRGPLRSQLLELRILKIVSETESFCWVEGLLLLKAPNQQETRDVFIRDGWVKVRGKWYHIIKDPVFFPAL